MLPFAHKLVLSMPRQPPAFVSASSATKLLPPTLLRSSFVARDSLSPPSRAIFGGLVRMRRRRARLAASPAPSATDSSARQLDRAPVEEEVDPGAVEGTSLRVLRYPHPLLRRHNEEVREDEMDEVKKIAKEMLLVMYASKGVGLAAPQVGINKRLMVFNAEGDSKAWLQEVVMVNPVIVSKSKPSVVDIEGCLSFPLMAGQVRRQEWVKVEATRLNGKKFKVKYEGWKARIFQHEFDHLDGILYIDRLEEEDGPKVQNRLGELVDEYEAAPYQGEPAAL